MYVNGLSPNQTFSTDIQEIDSGGFYGEPACGDRNQVEAYPNIWNYNDKFQQ